MSLSSLTNSTQDDVVVPRIFIYNQPMQDQDIITYLGQCFFTQESLQRKFFRHRSVVLRGLRDGVFNVKEFFQLLLPARLSPRKLQLLKRYNAYLREKSDEELSRYSPKGTPLSLFGHDFFDIDHRESIILINEIITLDQYQAKKFLKKNAVVIDAGANLGVFSIFATQQLGAGNVFAFEPVRRTFHLLEKNSRHYPQITCVNAGLGSMVSNKHMLSKGEGTVCNTMEDSALFEAPQGAQDTLEQVHVTTIDAFVAERELKQVDFIKIDTEGYEEKILQGATQTIQKHKPIIAMSAYHNINDVHKLPELLQSLDRDYACELYAGYEAVLVCRIP